MRSFTVISGLILFIISIACTGIGNDVTSPEDPHLLDEENGYDSFVWECRANMRTIASQAVIFYAQNSRYPKTQEEMGMGGVACPACGMTYLLSGGPNIFNIRCPLAEDPNHGNIDNGVCSWLYGPEYEEYICRENMLDVNNAALIYFAVNNRYPEDLVELGMAELECPSCNFSYIYYTYVDSLSSPAFYIGCPVISQQNHGFIDNGVPSWPEEPSEPHDVCHSNMITISSQAIIFYAQNSRYPKNLEEIGMAGTVCPSCMLTYEFVGTERYYYVGCPMTSDPNHGFIDNGVASWLETD